MTLNPTTGEFMAGTRGTGVYASRKRGRWQYRTDSGTLLGSGMEPGAFVLRFWLRDDFTN